MDEGSTALPSIEPFPIGTAADDPVGSMTLHAAIAAFQVAGNERFDEPKALAVLTAKTCETFGVETRRKPIVALVLKACAASFGGADVVEIPPSLLFATVNKVVGRVGRKWKFRRKLEFARSMLYEVAKATGDDGGVGLGEVLACA